LTTDANLTSATEFTILLSDAEQKEFNTLLDLEGKSANDATTYNLATTAQWGGITSSDEATNALTLLTSNLATVTIPTGANDNNASFTQDNFVDAGVLDTNSTNIDSLNSFLNTDDVNATDVNTTDKLQALNNAVNKLASNTDINSTDIVTLGLEDDINATDTNKMALLNDIIPDGNNSAANIEAIADGITLIQNVANGTTLLDLTGSDRTDMIAALSSLGVNPDINETTLNQYLKAIKQAGVNKADSQSELNDLADYAVNSVTKVDEIIVAASDGNASYTPEQLIATGVDVNDTNVDELMSFLNSGDINRSNLSDLSDLQELNDAVNKLVENTGDLNTTELNKLGLSDDMNTSDSNKTSLFNSVVPLADGENNASSIAAVAKAVDALQNVANGTTSLDLNSSDATAMLAHLKKLGVTPTITADNLDAYMEQVKDAGVSGANTITKLNTLAQTQKTVIDTTVSGADANNSNLSDANLTDAGITDVNSTNIATINSFLNTSDINGTDVNTSTKVQTLVDAINNLENNTTLDEGNLTVLGLDNDMNVSNTNQKALLNSIIPDGNNSAVHVKEIASIAARLQVVASGGTASPALTVADLAKIGITPTITADNLTGFLNNVKNAGEVNANELGKLNTLASTTTNAMNKIITASTENNATSGALTLADYNNTGINDANTSLVSLYNNYLDSDDVNGTDVNTTAKLQSLITVINKVDANATDLNATEIATLGLDDDLNTSDTNQMALFNDIVSDGNNTAEHLSELAQIVKKLQNVANGNASIPNGLTVADLATLGITPTITTDNLSAYLNAIKTATASGANTLDKLNSIADAVVNGVANLAQNAIDDDANVTDSNLTAMGITDVNTSNIDELNSFLNSSDINGSDVNTTTKLQELNDAVNKLVENTGELNTTELNKLGLSDDMNTSDSNKTSLFNSVVPLADGENNASSIAAVAKAVDALQNVAKGTTSLDLNSSDATAMIAHLKKLGVTPTITADNLDAYMEQVKDAGVSGANTITKLNALAFNTKK
jgi:hypothetical protein